MFASLFEQLEDTVVATTVGQSFFLIRVVPDLTRRIDNKV